MGLLKGGGASDDRLDAKTGENQTTVMDAMDSGGSGTTTADGGSTEVRYGELNESGDADQQAVSEQATDAFREEGLVNASGTATTKQIRPGGTARPLGESAAEGTPIANLGDETITLTGPRPIEKARETGVLQTTEGPIPLSSPRIQFGVPEVRLHNKGFYGSFEEATAAGFENIPSSANVRTGSEEATGGGVPVSTVQSGGAGGAGGMDGAGGPPRGSTATGGNGGSGGGGGLSGLAIAGVLGLAAVAFGVIGS